MKPEVKYWSHEVEYVLISFITLILLSVIVFPLFIALLPIVVIAGCVTIWNADHTPKKM
jgi:hypothetical protein